MYVRKTKAVEVLRGLGVGGAGGSGCVWDGKTEIRRCVDWMTDWCVRWLEFWLVDPFLACMR